MVPLVDWVLGILQIILVEGADTQVALIDPRYCI